jgi:hypothetical protein
MAIKIIGTTSGVEVDTDANKNLYVTSGLPAVPAAGGYYIATGGPTGIVAAALAANSDLVSLRFATGSTRKAYISKFELIVTIATVGASAGVGGVLGLRRFTTATPSGGTARIASELDETSTGTDMTDIRDSATALTVTSVVFPNTGELAWFRQSVSTVGNATIYTFEPFAAGGYPLVLNAGDGIALSTRVAMAATQTWVYSWRCNWEEA